MYSRVFGEANASKHLNPQSGDPRTPHRATAPSYFSPAASRCTPRPCATPADPDRARLRNAGPIERGARTGDSVSMPRVRLACRGQSAPSRLSASYLSGWFTRMHFPPRCYYCHRPIGWPFGLVVFQGSVEWHVAHRACLAKKRAHPYAHLWPRARAKQKPPSSL